MTTRLEWAQWMGAKGFGVFVVIPGTKDPLDGYSWYSRQSQDPDEIAKLFAKKPNCNYGVYPGEGYVVIDLDTGPGKDGIKAFNDICAENGLDGFLDIDTMMVNTPSGGVHLYFKAPFATGIANDFPDGIDVRGVNGYVVGPGSELPNGEYELCAAEIADLPTWLEEYTRPPGHRDPKHDVPLIDLDLEENIVHALNWLQTREPAIQGEHGDDWTLQTIQFLRDFGLSPGKMHEVMNLGWNQNCDPPWGDNELERKIDNAWRYGQNRPGIKAPSYRAHLVNMGAGGGLWKDYLTPESVAELFNPTKHLRLVVDNDDGIPTDVEDDDIDPVTGEAADEFPYYDVNDFAVRGSVREYIVQNWLLAHGITHMIAKRGTGKSTVALDLAFHIACDMEWCNHKIMPGWKVLYICGEDDVGMELNVRAWMAEHDVKKIEPGRFRVAADIIKLTEERKLHLRLREIIQWADGERVVVILDTWQRATSGWSKNDQQDMERAVENAELIAKHLRGPMISLVHPPKDGRMTVVGSGIQEDTSSGLYHLEEHGNGAVRLKIDRIKGPGYGKYLIFTLKQVELDKLDAFGKPLTGLVAMNKGGDMTEDSVTEKDRLDREMRGYAAMIRGVGLAGMEYPDLPAVGKLNVKNIAEFMGTISQNYGDDTPLGLDCTDFGDRFCCELVDFAKGGVRGLTFGKVRDRLTELYTKHENPPPIVTGDGKWLMLCGADPNSKAKNPQKTFKIKPNTPD